MQKVKKDNNFIKQAGILAGAGILCRIIGILYRRPLTQLIGKEGLGYYSIAYTIYAMILLISSYSIPAAISKEISKKLAIKDYKNAQRIFHCALIYVSIVGAIASVFTYFFAGLFVEANSVIVLRVFAPTIFLSGLLGVFRGYFQAHRTMVQTSISQILEQIFNAVISVVAAYFLLKFATTTDSTSLAIRGAIGGAIGTSVSVIFALFFILAIYLLNRTTIQSRLQKSAPVETETYQEIFKMILFTVTPFILSTFVYNLSTSFNQTIFIKILMNLKGFQESVVSGEYGIFSGESIVIINIPIALAASLSTAILPNISAAFSVGDFKELHSKIDIAIRVTMLISIPSAFGLGVLAMPVVQTLFPQKDTLLQASLLVRYLSISIVFYSLSTLTNAILQGIGKVNVPIINALMALFIQSIVLVILLLTTTLTIYSLVIATIVYSLFMCIFNAMALKRNLSYRMNYKKSLFVPFCSALIMGIIAYFSYQLCFLLLKSNMLSLFLSIFVSAFAYFILIIKFGGINETELNQMPKGAKIIGIAKKMHLL